MLYSIVAKTIIHSTKAADMQAYDGEGYKRLSGGDEFLVWLEGPVTVHAEVEDREDGTYTATYSTTMAGIYELYITNGDFPACKLFGAVAGMTLRG